MSSTGTPSQPFPTQAIFTLEAHATKSAGEALLPVTLLMPALGELWAFTCVYLERFGKSGPSVGQSVLVRGEHGSGKTHALGYLMDKVRRGESSDPVRAKPVLQLYAKAENVGLADIYRNLISQISMAQVRNLAWRFTAEIAGEVIAATEPDAEESVELRRRLREEPQLFKELLRVYFVDESDVLRRRDEELGRLTGGSKDFVNAFFWIDSELGELAYRWLSGAQLDPSQMRKLGVTSEIDSAEMAKFGLQLMAALCSRSEIPLIVVIDQYEKLILDGQGELNQAAAGTIHTLAEVVPQEDAMLVLAGNEEAWRALPVDLQQRFGFRVVECHGLDLNEAAALVNLYLNPRQEVPIDHELSDSELHPFTLDGLRLLHLYSGGNVRQLLELCAVAYEASGPDATIDRKGACLAAELAGTERIDVASVVQATRLVAEARGYAVTPSPDLRGGGAGPLRMSVAGLDRVLVVIGQAAHYYDEVLDAAQYVDLIETLRLTDPGVHLVLLVLGYESPEVRDALRRAGLEVVRFRPRTFATDFGRVLDEIGESQGGETGVGDRLTSEIQEIRAALEALKQEREADTRGLQASTSRLEQLHEEERIADRWRQATYDWVAERRKLEDGIREARRSRRAAELDELGQLREHAEYGRTRRQQIVLWLFSVATVATTVATYFAVHGERRVTEGGTRLVAPGWALPLAVAGWATLLSIVSGAYWILMSRGRWSLRDWLGRSRTQQELATPVSSAEDLRRLAHRASLEPAPLRSYLRNGNPQVRFVAAITADGYEVGDLAKALAGERCSLVRKAYAKRLGSTPDIVGGRPPTVEFEMLDAVYILDSRLRSGFGEWLAERPIARGGPLGIVRTMYLESELTPAARALVASGVSREAVVEGFDSAVMQGLPFSARKDLRRLSAEALRNATRAVSPFESPGLGTFDDLGIIDDVDSAFLVLSQLLFLSELGLLVDYQ